MHLHANIRVEQRAEQRAEQSSFLPFRGRGLPTRPRSCCVIIVLRICMLVNVIIEPPFILVLGVIKTDLRIGVDFFQPKLHGKLLIELVIPVILERRSERGGGKAVGGSGMQWDAVIKREGVRKRDGTGEGETLRVRS